MAGVSLNERQRRDALLAEGFKRCPKCTETVSTTDYYPSSSSRDGFGSYCRPCSKNVSGAWKAENPHRVRETYSDWFERNRDDKRARGRDHWWSRHEDDPLWQRLKTGAHRARAAGCVAENITGPELLAYWESQGIDPGSCAFCGGRFEQVDHVQPLARGGGHVMGNLAPSCRGCNRGKKDKPLVEFLADRAERLKVDR